MTLKLPIQWPSRFFLLDFPETQSLTNPHLMSQSAGPRWQSLSRQSQNGTDECHHWNCGVTAPSKLALQNFSALQSETWSKSKQETQKWSQPSCHFATVVLSGIKSTPTVCNKSPTKKLACMGPWSIWTGAINVPQFKMLCLVGRPPPITQLDHTSQEAWWHLAGLGPWLGIWTVTPWAGTPSHNWGTPRCWGPSSTPPHWEVQERF